MLKTLKILFVFLLICLTRIGLAQPSGKVIEQNMVKDTVISCEVKYAAYPSIQL